MKVGSGSDDDWFSSRFDPAQDQVNNWFKFYLVFFSFIILIFTHCRVVMNLSKIIHIINTL